MLKRLQILGTRGIPASHGGFETFAEDLALHLVGRGWKVTVYCQVDAKDGEKEIAESEWQGVRLVRVPIGTPGALGTVFFDWKSTWHAASRGELVLTLGYNTALFCAIHRLRGVRNVINMDGLEWKRTKYGFAKRAWMYVNEWLGAWFGQRLVADHPEIARHLESRTRGEKIVTIPYGARAVEQANVGKLVEYGLEAGRYALVIARPEPENNILEIVRAYSRRKRGMPLVVLGNYEVEGYPARVREVAGEEVLFPGAIYEKEKVDALRFFGRLYVHGHTVGGTNPSLLEAMGAGMAVLAHDNPFNRWVAGEGAKFFQDEASCESQLDELLGVERSLEGMRQQSRQRFEENFTLERCRSAYEDLLERELACSGQG